MATYQRPKKVKNQKEDPAELIVNRLDKSAGRFEQLIEKYKREIVWTIGGIIIVFLGYMAYHTWIAKPSQIEAAEELAFAQKAYEMDSLYLALDGTPANLGLVKIADQYSSTPAGNIAKYLAGAAYYRLGNYDKAVSYFEKYSADDEITSAQALGIIGDCYAQTGKAEEALKYYVKAAGKRDNDFTAPFYLMKAGNTAMYLKKYSDAAKYFETIKNKYPDSSEAATVDKYLEFAKAAAQNK